MRVSVRVAPGVYVSERVGSSRRPYRGARRPAQPRKRYTWDQWLLGWMLLLALPLGIVVGAWFGWTLLLVAFLGAGIRPALNRRR